MQVSTNKYVCMHASPSVWAHGHEAIWAFATMPASKKKNATPGKGRGHAPQPGQNSPGHLRTDMYPSVHVQTRRYTYVHVRTRTYTYVLVRARTYTYVLVRTRTYTHVHIRTCPLGFSPAWDPSHPRVGFFFFCWLAGWGSSLAWMAVLAGRPSLAMPLLSGVSIKLLH